MEVVVLGERLKKKRKKKIKRDLRGRENMRVLALENVR